MIGPGVGPLVDEVHGAAGQLHPVGEGLRLGVHARESRQQGGVHVDHPLRGTGARNSGVRSRMKPASTTSSTSWAAQRRATSARSKSARAGKRRWSRAKRRPPRPRWPGSARRSRARWPRPPPGCAGPRAPARRGVQQRLQVAAAARASTPTFTRSRRRCWSRQELHRGIGGLARRHLPQAKHRLALGGQQRLARQRPAPRPRRRSCRPPG